MMKIETKASLAALLAGLFVVGASYGVSAIVVSQKQTASATKTQMTRSMGRMTNKMWTMNASIGSPQLIATGRSLFSEACSSCHGSNAQGAFGPNLHELGLPDAKVAAVIRNGVKGKMPAYGNKYSAAQQQALVAYVQSLNK